MSHSHDLPPDLLETAKALEEHRPRLTEHELAGIKQRAAGPAQRRTARPTGGFMRSRLAITALLATGALMSSGGAALGVSALSTDLTASSAQYGTPTEQSATGGSAGAPTPGSGEILGTSEQSVAPPKTTGSTAGRNEVAGANDNPPSTTVAAQAPRQLSASSADELPFTGYAAIPMLFIGITMLGSGLVLRRSTRRDRPQ
jgi:hypothetical protein